MQALQLVRCLIGRHHRDRKRARHDADGAFVSRCTGCKRPMVKDGNNWRLAQGRSAGQSSSGTTAPS